MARIGSLLLAVLLLTACASNRAQTVEPPPTTLQPSPTLPPAAATPTAALIPTESPTTEPTTIPPTTEHTSTPAPTNEPTPVPSPTVENTPIPTEEPTAVPPTTPPTQPPIADANSVDQAALLAGLLTINDMPTGWAGEAAVFEPRTPGGTYNSFCTDLPRRSIAAAYVEFERSALGPFITHTIVVYPDSANARAALDDLTAAAQSCPQVTDDTGSVNTISPLSFPSLGDHTFAVRSSGTVEMDAIYVLVDNVLITINHGNLGAVDSTLTESVARAAVARYGR